jgi:hypothetical protein
MTYRSIAPLAADSIDAEALPVETLGADGGGLSLNDSGMAGWAMALRCQRVVGLERDRCAWGLLALGQNMGMAGVASPVT